MDVEEQLKVMEANLAALNQKVSQSSTRRLAWLPYCSYTMNWQIPSPQAARWRPPLHD